MTAITKARKAIAIHDEYAQLRGVIEVGIQGEPLREQAAVAFDFVLNNGLMDDSTLRGLVDNMIGRIRARMESLANQAQELGYPIENRSVERPPEKEIEEEIE